MSERLTRRVGALESKSRIADIEPIRFILSAYGPGPNGPLRLYDMTRDGKILRRSEHNERLSADYVRSLA